jgi:hypothetical protein
MGEIHLTGIKAGGRFPPMRTCFEEAGSILLTPCKNIGYFLLSGKISRIGFIAGRWPLARAVSRDTGE